MLQLSPAWPILTQLSYEPVDAATYPSLSTPILALGVSVGIGAYLSLA